LIYWRKAAETSKGDDDVVVSYLRALPSPKLLLWCYFIWYGFVVVRYFEANLALWSTSLGLSAIIGTGLYVSTAYTGATRRVLGLWPVFRFYLMPFCVSSFAALIKDRGFILIFHPTARDNLLAASLCAAFCALVFAAKYLPPDDARRAVATRS
jgi:hypothetical protein